MSKYEKEVKVLNIDVEETKLKLINIGANYLGTKNQKIYTYDIPTIYYRFMESIELLDTSNELLIKTTISKLRIILDEFCDLVDEEKLKGIFKEMNILNFDELLSKNSIEIKNILVSSKLFEEEISNKLINPNKWVRLRQSNDKI